METIEKKVSSLVENQFPSFLRNEAPLFVSFVRYYYKWLESQYPAVNSEFQYNGTVTIEASNNNLTGNLTNLDTHFTSNDFIAVYVDNEKTSYDILKIKEVVNSTHIILDDSTLPSITLNNVPFSAVINKKNALYWSRRLLDNQDVDLCDPEVLIYFKEKYLKDIKIDTLVDIKRLIKYSLDLYRSKGTERSIDLLYKAVFGKPATVYHPSTDIFTTSSGRWYQPKYIELSLNEINKTFTNKQIRGKTSGATAFVDSVVRKNVNGIFRDIAYISSINGDFLYGEKIVDDKTPIELCPKNVGSLNEVLIDVNGTGSDFNVGDLVEISSQHGSGAIGQVTVIGNSSGAIEYDLDNGGFGYTTNAEIIISDHVITINAITTENSYFSVGEQIIQPLASIEITDSNGIFFAESNVYTYHANNELKGTGYILNSLYSDTTSGTLTVSVLSGNLDSTEIYTESNTVSANISQYVDETVTANVVGYHSNVVLSVSNLNSEQISLGQYLVQPSTNSTGIVRGVFFTNQLNTEADITLSNVTGVFHADEIVQNNVTGFVDGVKINVGVKKVGNNEYNLIPENYIHGTNSNTVGSLVDYVQGTANISITSFTNDDVAVIGTDIIEDYANVSLNAEAYGFPANPSGNAETPMQDLFNFDEYNVYSIGSIRVDYSDTGLLRHPIITIWDPHIAELNYPSTVYLSVINQSGSLVIGDIVRQEATGAKGQIKQFGNGQLIIQQLRFNSENKFVPTSNSSTIIYTEQTGAIATVTNVLATDETKFGQDSVVLSRFVDNNGSIISLNILDSGFGYIQGEELVLRNNDNIGLGIAKLNNFGQGEGYYKTKNGFLSSRKKLFDGIYYQPYSYEIRSSVINKYRHELKKITHVAGTMAFDRIIYDTILDSPQNINVEIKIE